MKREKPGRKPIQDKAIPITVYLRKSKVDEKGGKAKVREAIKDFIELPLNG